MFLCTPAWGDIASLDKVNIWPVGGTGVPAWDSSPLYASILGVSQAPGGPLISLPSTPGVYYLYLGNLANFPTTGNPYLAIYSTDTSAVYSGVGTWGFTISGSPGTFQLWKWDGLNDYWTGSGAPIYWGWAGGTADLVNPASSGLSSDGFDDAYLVLGIGVQPTAVPIPAAAWLLGSGLIGLVALKRRYNK